MRAVLNSERSLISTPRTAAGSLTSTAPDGNRTILATSLTTPGNIKTGAPNATRTVLATTLPSPGSVASGPPVVVRNQINELNSIEDMLDVFISDKIDGATIVYNATTRLYEIRPIQAADFSGTFNVDGGNF